MKSPEEWWSTPRPLRPAPSCNPLVVIGDWLNRQARASLLAGINELAHVALVNQKNLRGRPATRHERPDCVLLNWNECSCPPTTFDIMRPLPLAMPRPSDGASVSM